MISMMHWESIICPRCVKFGDNCCLAEDKKRQEAVERHRCRAVWGDGAVLVPFSLFVFPRHKYYSRSSFSRSLPSRDSQLRGHTAASPPPLHCGMFAPCICMEKGSALFSLVDSGLIVLTAEGQAIFLLTLEYVPRNMLLYHDLVVFLVRATGK